MVITDRIPGLVSGILFCFLTSAHANLELARELVAEGDYVNARSEAVRSSPVTDDQQLIQMHVLAVT